MFSGVLVLSVLFTVAGLAILFGARGWATGGALVRELGLALILGLAAIGALANLALILGFGLSMGVSLLLVLFLGASCVAVGVVRRRPLPRRLDLGFAIPRTLDDALAAIAAAITLIVALVMFRAMRHQPLFAYDAWNFWLPKAKTIYFFHGIDSALFKSLPAPSYPLLVPAVDAMAFRFAGSTDPAVIAQLDWVVLIGLIGAVASLVAPLSRRSLTWLFLALFVVIPQVSFRWFQLLGDWTLDAFFVISALLLVRWLLTRERWLLTVLPFPFAAMLVTKREGQLFALCLVIGVAAAAFREWRTVVPRVAGVAAASYVVSQLPWHIWWSSRHLPSDLHEGGVGHVGSLHRALTAAHVVADLMFSYGMWLFAVPLALGACAAVFIRGGTDRRPAVALITTLGLLFVGFTWIIWSDPNMPLDSNPALNPVPREVGSTALLSLVFAPLLLTGVLGTAPVASTTRLRGETSLLSRWYGTIASASPTRVVGALVVAQWALVLGVAAIVRHASWIYYQGGDQLWYYTTGWLLVHGHFPQPGVGFLWPILLAPIALVTGPNAANAFPAIILLQVLILLPVALVTMYGIGRQIAGRVFGYWAAALWIIVPVIGIWFTDAGYHQRYTEVLLPQAFGLTAMADLPATVAVLVSGYFCVRALASSAVGSDAVAAGIAAGAAIAIKPSAALFLAGPVLAFAVARQPRVALRFAAGIAPAVIALAFVKWRGFGYLPVFHSAAGVRLAADHAVPLAAAGLGKYLHFNWAVFTGQLDQVREHFWSVRVVEWLVVAGSLAAILRSRKYGTLLVGWFAATVLIKTGSGRGGLEGGNLLRLLMPAYPAFIVMLASLPFLVPGVSRRVPDGPPAQRRLSDRTRLKLLIAGVLLTAVVPIAAFAATKPVRGPNPNAAILEQPPIPLRIDLGLRAARAADGIALTWRAQHPAGGPVFYHVFRASPGAAPVTCGNRIGWSADYCQLELTDLGTTRSPSFDVLHPPPGRWAYFVGVAANWLDDTTQGDVYLLSQSVVAS